MALYYALAHSTASWKAYPSLADQRQAVLVEVTEPLAAAAGAAVEAAAVAVVA